MPIKVDSRVPCESIIALQQRSAAQPTVHTLPIFFQLTQQWPYYSQWGMGMAQFLCSAKAPTDVGPYDNNFPAVETPCIAHFCADKVHTLA
jgi:hypothetical protein